MSLAQAYWLTELVGCRTAYSGLLLAHRYAEGGERQGKVPLLRHFLTAFRFSLTAPPFNCALPLLSSHGVLSSLSSRSACLNHNASSDLNQDALARCENFVHRQLPLFLYPLNLFVSCPQQPTKPHPDSSPGERKPDLTSLGLPDLPFFWNLPTFSSTWQSLPCSRSVLSAAPKHP